MPVDMVAEAEKIINNYLGKMVAPPVKSKKRKIESTLNVIMLIGCLILVGLLLYVFIG